MKAPAELRQAAMELVAKFDLSPDEFRTRLANAVNPEYWRQLSPEFPLSESSGLEALAVAPEAQREVERHFVEELYFKTPPLLPASSLARLNAAIDAVQAAGWPPLFSLVSDAFWHCARLPAIRSLLKARLGNGYAQIPHFWIHIVRAVDGAGGWLPHFDGFRNKRVSVWLALTEATVENGCIFVVPPKLLPESFRTLELHSLETIDVLKALHATRALPVPAGTALGWDFDVFHWGGRAVTPQFERRAISMEFLGPDEQAMRDEEPLIDLDGPLPHLNLRLKMIGMGLDEYSKREPMSHRFKGLAQELLRLD